MSSRYLSRDEVDGTRRAIAGSARESIPSREIPWRSLDEEKGRPGCRRSDRDPEHEGRAHSSSADRGGRAVQRDGGCLRADRGLHLVQLEQRHPRRRRRRPRRPRPGTSRRPRPGSSGSSTTSTPTCSSCRPSTGSRTPRRCSASRRPSGAGRRRRRASRRWCSYLDTAISAKANGIATRSSARPAFTRRSRRMNAGHPGGHLQRRRRPPSTARRNRHQPALLRRPGAVPVRPAARRSGSSRWSPLRRDRSSSSPRRAPGTSSRATTAPRRC